LQHGVDPVVGLLLKVFGGDAGDSGGDDALLLHAVADHDHILQHHRVFFEDDVDLASAAYQDGPADVTDGRDVKHGIRSGIDDEGPVHIGRRAARRPLDEHGCPDDGLSGCILDGSFHLLGLCGD
jgi:hypothetical protein